MNFHGSFHIIQLEVKRVELSKCPHHFLGWIHARPCIGCLPKPRASSPSTLSRKTMLALPSLSLYEQEAKNPNFPVRARPRPALSLSLSSLCGLDSM